MVTLAPASIFAIELTVTVVAPAAAAAVKVVGENIAASFIPHGLKLHIQNMNPVHHIVWL